MLQADVKLQQIYLVVDKNMVEKINSLLGKLESIEDEEIASHLLNYICVLISGYLETNIESIICHYKNTEHCNTHECKDNIKSLRKIQNAKWCAIRPILMNIDENILSLLREELIYFEDVVASIDNIVKTRHKIAHGENVTNLTESILRTDFINIQNFANKTQAVFECL